MRLTSDFLYFGDEGSTSWNGIYISQLCQLEMGHVSWMRKKIVLANEILGFITKAEAKLSQLV